MLAKWAVLVGRDGVPFGACLLPITHESVHGLHAAVTAQCAGALALFPDPTFTIYENSTAFKERRAPLAPAADIHAFGNTYEDALVVVASFRQRDVFPYPTATPALQAAFAEATGDVQWFGLTGKKEGSRGIDLNSSRTLIRQALTQKVISRLDTPHVVHVDSPWMTGKTTLAALVCQELNRQAFAERRRIAIANVSMRLFDRPKFREVFQQQCGIEWGQFLDMATRGYKLYIVVDDVQTLYPPGSDLSEQGSSEYWRLVEEILADAGGNIYVLQLAVCGCQILGSPYAPPVPIPSECVLCIDDLNFNREEVREYVNKAFDGVGSLQVDENMTRFCELLHELTEGHVGLCTAAIGYMNEVAECCAHMRYPFLTADGWVEMMQFGQLNKSLVGRWESTRAVQELDCPLISHLERLLTIDPDGNDKMDQVDVSQAVDECVRGGILTYHSDGQVAFSSPVQWRFFVKQCVEWIERAEATVAPATLDELMKRSLRVFDTNGVRIVHGEHHFCAGRRLLKHALELTFYKAVHRESPAWFEISLGIRAHHGSSVSSQLAVRAHEHLWYIELLHDPDQIKLDQACDRVNRDEDHHESDKRRKCTDMCQLVFCRAASNDGEKGDATISKPITEYVVRYDEQPSEVVATTKPISSASVPDATSTAMVLNLPPREGCDGIEKPSSPPCSPLSVSSNSSTVSSP